MTDTRQRRIKAGSLIPDDMVTPDVERLARAFWDGSRASDGFSQGWDRLLPLTRETTRAGVVSLLAQQTRDRAADTTGRKRVSEAIEKVRHSARVAGATGFDWALTAEQEAVDQLLALLGVDA